MRLAIPNATVMTVHVLIGLLGVYLVSAESILFRPRLPFRSYGSEYSARTRPCCNLGQSICSASDRFLASSGLAMFFIAPDRRPDEWKPLSLPLCPGPPSRCSARHMKTAIAYVRVSTGRQGKSGLGLEAQQAALVRFAEAEGYDLDPDVSGSGDRQGQRRAGTPPPTGRGAARGQEAQSTNRRRQAGQAEPRRSLHLRPYAAQDALHRGGAGADADPFMLHVYAALAEKERAMISRRTKDAPAASTTLADLFTPLLSADLSSAVRASLRSWLNDEIDDGLAYGWQARLRRGTVNSFLASSPQFQPRQICSQPSATDLPTWMLYRVHERMKIFGAL